MKHQQHDLLIAIANGEQMQLLQENLAIPTWIDCNGTCSLVMITSTRKVRIKPKTIRIGDMEVPEPMRVAPACGVTYWGVFLNEPSIDVDNWQGMDCEVRWLKTGLLHATEQGAQQMLAALVKQLGGVL